MAIIATSFEWLNAPPASHGVASGAGIEPAIPFPRNSHISQLRAQIMMNLAETATGKQDECGGILG